MPDWIGEIQRRLGASGMDPASESEVVTELAQTLEDRYAELRGEGLDEAAARDAVLHELREMPAITDSLPRSRRGRAVDGHDGPGGSMGSGRIAVDVVRDFRYAWRGMRKAPVLTVFAGLSLALGIGANTTVFTIINTLLLHPIPAAEPSRLVMVYESGAKESRQARNNLPLSYPNFEDLAKAQRCFGAWRGSLRDGQCWPGTGPTTGGSPNS